MIQFTATIHQFAEQGEKTGWTYIEIPEDIAQQLKPGNKKSFRVKGKLDAFPVSGVALMPMGNGTFIMALNAGMRKGIRKKKGAMLKVTLTADNQPLSAPPEFMECLEDEPKAKETYGQLKTSHRNYYIKWLGGVKSEAAVAKRMALAINGLAKGYDFAQFIRSMKGQKEI